MLSLSDAMNENRIQNLKVTHKILLLVLLGLSMSIILLISNEIASYNKDSYEEIQNKLQGVQNNLVNAVAAELRFLSIATEADKDMVIEHGKQALDAVIELESASLDNEKTAQLKSQLEEYLTTFESVSTVVIEGKKTNDQYRQRLSEIDVRVSGLLSDLRDHIGKESSSAKIVDKFIMSQVDVLRNVNLLITRDFMTLQNRILLQGDVEGYEKFAKINSTELKAQLRNFRVINKVLQRRDYEEFSKSGTDIFDRIAPLPDLSIKIADLWSERIAAYKTVNVLRDEIQKNTKFLIEEEIAASENRLLLIKLLQYGVTLVLCVLFIVFSYYLAGSIIRPLLEVIEFASRIKKGDLSSRIQLKAQNEMGQLAGSFNEMADSLQHKAAFASQVAGGDLSKHVDLASDKDALGQALEKMVIDLNMLLSQVNTSVEYVDGGAQQLSDSSLLLSQGATEQAASLEEIGSSVAELVSRTKTNAENATQANLLSGEASSAADYGNKKMAELISAMDDINASGSQIAKIIKVIDEIAFQTNLLALNAAVEAARAGKYGKGFAVVADEVRSLASRSATAAHETEEMIEAAVKKTENGTRIVNETAEALGEIVLKITKATDLVGEITAASNEQAEGLSQINQGLNQVDKITQQNAANAEETASTSELFKKQAGHLSGLVAQFKLAESSDSFSEPASDIHLIENRQYLLQSESVEADSFAWSEEKVIDPPAMESDRTIVLDEGEFKD